MAEEKINEEMNLEAEEAAAEETVEESTAETEENGIEQEMQELKDNMKDLNDRYLRLMADFDNYKKRAAKDRDEMVIYSASKFAEGLFPVIDNFKRALDAAEDKEDGFYQGIEMIYNQLKDFLKNEGIEVIKADGEKFDPTMHYAVAVEKDEEKENDDILEVFQDGYIYKERVLRPAMVKVNKL